MDDSRFTDLEIRYAHLERLVDELSQVVAGQSRAIEALKTDLRAVAERMQTPHGNEAPPHY